MNDPNGMVYLDGRYHMFFQHNPDSTIWGPMHWGQATSMDLLNWQQGPIAEERYDNRTSPVVAKDKWQLAFSLSTVYRYRYGCRYSCDWVGGYPMNL